VEGDPSRPCRCEPVPLSLALTEYPFLIFPGQVYVQISWTMVVHELAAVNLIFGSAETIWCLDNIRAVVTTTLSAH